MQGPKRVDETDGADLFLEYATLGWNLERYRYHMIIPYGMAVGVTAAVTGYPIDEASSIGDSLGSVDDTYVAPIGNMEPPGAPLIDNTGLANGVPFIIDICNQGIFESLRVEFTAGGSAYATITSWGVNPRHMPFGS